MTPSLYALGKTLRRAFRAVRLCDGCLEARTAFGWERAGNSPLAVSLLINRRCGNRPGNCLLVTVAG